MSNNLLVSVLGNRKSGKSTTWNTLFGKTVRTGWHNLYFDKNEHVKVFLVAGSPQERDAKVEKLLPHTLPRIVLCSIQYLDDARNTFNFFRTKDYFFFVHWLNPGYNQVSPVNDPEGFTDWLLNYESLVGIRNGKLNPKSRVNNMKDFIYGWSKSRGLII